MPPHLVFIIDLKTLSQVVVWDSERVKLVSNQIIDIVEIRGNTSLSKDVTFYITYILMSRPPVDV